MQETILEWYTGWNSNIRSCIRYTNFSAPSYDISKFHFIAIWKKNDFLEYIIFRVENCDMLQLHFTSIDIILVVFIRNCRVLVVKHTVHLNLPSQNDLTDQARNFMCPYSLLPSRWRIWTETRNAFCPWNSFYTRHFSKIIIFHFSML